MTDKRRRFILFHLPDGDTVSVFFGVGPKGDQPPPRPILDVQVGNVVHPLSGSLRVLELLPDQHDQYTWHVRGERMTVDNC